MEFCTFNPHQLLPPNRCRQLWNAKHIPILRTLNLIIALLTITIISFGRNGKIDKFGFFRFKSSVEQFRYLEYLQKEHIDGESFIYLHLINQIDRKRITVILSNDSPILKQKFSRRIMKTRNLKVDSIQWEEYKSFALNDSLINANEKLRFKQLVKSYINKKGVIENIENEEFKNVILLRLLKRKYQIGINDISGDLNISKRLIRF